MVDQKYVFNLFKLEKQRSQTALVAGANGTSFVNVATFDKKWRSAAHNNCINLMKSAMVMFGRL